MNESSRVNDGEARNATRPLRHRVLAAAIPISGCCGFASGTLAGEKPPKSPWDLKLFRFEFDDDILLGSDNAISAAWSVQIHSRLMDQWNPTYAGWIGKLPGLGDDGEGGRVVRWAYALSQIIITPDDISIEAPQPNDSPWAGLLGATGTWSSYDNRKLGAVQIYLGCMGPCSQADTVQKFTHEDLGWGEPPKGWDNQLSDKALANLNYEYRHKLYKSQEADYLPKRFATDMAIGAQGAVGNLETFLRGGVEFRFGWGLPMGFTKIPDPAGIGMVLDPVYFDPKQSLVDLTGWRIYFNLVARLAWITYFAPAEGGPTENGGDHPPFDVYPGSRQAQFGVHLTRVPYSVHITYFRYFQPLPSHIVGTLDWINLSFEYRF